jgi:hypothetical protein
MAETMIFVRIQRRRRGCTVMEKERAMMSLSRSDRPPMPASPISFNLSRIWTLTGELIELPSPYTAAESLYVPISLTDSDMVGNPKVPQIH